MRILGCCGWDVHYNDYSSWTFWCGVNTCVVGPIGTPGTHTGPKGRVPKTLGSFTWYITSQYVAMEFTHTHTHILAMAPSGGSTSLGTQARKVDDFLTITRDDILNWTPQRLRRQCFQFGLVNEAPEGDVTTLRAVFLKHWTAAVSAASAAATQETEGDGAGASAASEGLPHSLRGQPPQLPHRTMAYLVRLVYRSRTALSSAQNGTLLRSPGTWTPKTVPWWTHWTRGRRDCFSPPDGTLTRLAEERPLMQRRLLPATPPIAACATRHRALPCPVTCLVTVLATHRMARAPRMAARTTTRTPGAKMKQWMTWRPRP